MCPSKKLKVFTNGCFYLIHPGHINLFKRIKELFPNYDLVVGINSHKSIQLNKPNRKIELFSDIDRVDMINSIQYVDKVILFDEKTPIDLIKKIKPTVIVKGGDYSKKEIVGTDLVECTMIINFSTNYSTTSILSLIKNH